MGSCFYSTSYGLSSAQYCSSGQLVDEIEVFYQDLGTWYSKDESLAVEKIFNGAPTRDDDNHSAPVMTSKVASAKEMTYVTNLVGIKPRDGLWRKCYDQSSDPVGTAQVRWCKCKLTQGPGLG